LISIYKYGNVIFMKSGIKTLLLLSAILLPLIMPSPAAATEKKEAYV